MNAPQPPKSDDSTPPITGTHLGLSQAFSRTAWRPTVAILTPQQAAAFGVCLLTFLVTTTFGMWWPSPAPQLRLNLGAGLVSVTVFGLPFLLLGLLLARRPMPSIALIAGLVSAVLQHALSWAAWNAIVPDFRHAVPIELLSLGLLPATLGVISCGSGALPTCRLTPRCSGPHPGVRPGEAAELMRR